MSKPDYLKKIIIVGGGFGGVRAALDLVNKHLVGIKIILISDKPHFEYHPALYRVVTGRSPLEVCIPLREVFKGKEVEVLADTISQVNLKEKRLKGTSGCRYSFDFLVLALGSETIYFNIPGLEELSFGFKSIAHALRLKEHLHKFFCAAKKAESRKRMPARIIVLGGGASGVELAGELAIYSKKLAKSHGLDPGLVAIDLIEAAPRLLPALPPDISDRAARRLRSLAVKIFLKQRVVREDIEKVYLKNSELKSKTVIWTAGVKPHQLYSRIPGLIFTERAQVVVNEFLEAPTFSNVFIIGDAAATPYAGMAQTALHQGRFIAKIIERKLTGRPLLPYQPRAPFYALPVGPGWAMVIIGRLRFYGRLGWWLRRLADFRFFLSILPWRKALTAFQSGRTLCESCAICSPEK